MSFGVQSTTTTVERQVTPPSPIVLHLRLPETQPEPQETRPAQPHAVTWDPNVDDNEGKNRRKSKKCCIFHKQRPFDESDSDSDDESDGGWELDERGVPRWVSGNKGGDHDHGDCNCGDSH